MLATLIKGGDYDMPAGDLAFSVIVFTICAITCICMLMIRRWFCGGMLGGSGFPKYFSAFFSFSLWLVYVSLSINRSYETKAAAAADAAAATATAAAAQ